MTAEPENPGGAIVADLPCTGCRYNLRGLRPEGRCPECGLEIARSIDRSPAMGQWPVQVLGNLVFALILALASVIISMAAVAVGPDRSRALSQPVVYAQVLSWALGWYAVWRLGRAIVVDDLPESRWALRIIVSLYVMTLALGNLEISDLWPAVLFVVLSLLFVGRLMWIRSLAGRRPRPWPILFVLPAWVAMWMLPTWGPLDALLGPLPVLFSPMSVVVSRLILGEPLNLVQHWELVFPLFLSVLHFGWVLFLADTLRLSLKAMSLARSHSHQSSAMPPEPIR